MRGYKKIVDTTKFPGKADDFLTYSAEFERWIKQFSKAEIMNINPVKIAEDYNLRGFVFGNYVTQEERYYFLFKVKEQLRLLKKISGKKDLGLGLLTIGFGANGKAHSLAHFNPKDCMINLNRGRKSDFKSILMGENSFIHEYGHFVDYITGRREEKFNKNFASENKMQYNQVPSAIRRISKVVDLIQADFRYMDTLSKQHNAKYLKDPVEIWARAFEVGIQNIVENRYWKEFGRVFPRGYESDIYIDKLFVSRNKIDIDVIHSIRSIGLSREQRNDF